MNLLQTILYNHRIKHFFNNLLESKLFINNPVYIILNNIFVNKNIKKYSTKPFALRIENTNLCNGRCYMCPHSFMKRKQGTMTFNLFKKIIDQAVQLKIDYINLHNFGEPLIDKNFFSKVKYAKSIGIKKVSTNTNGQLLSKINCQKIIDSSLDELYISVDAATSNTYKKIRIGLNYQIVAKNIKLLSTLKKRLNIKHPKIILDFLETNLNKNEKNKFIKKWQNIVDHICISKIHDWSNKIKIDQKIKQQNFVSFSQIPCRLPFTELLINWNGTVSLCCQDIEGEIILGDITKQSLTTIWKNKKFQQIRKQHLLLKTDKLKICQSCKLRTFWWTF